MRIALFGRFQPLHLGHEEIIRRIDEEGTPEIFVCGSYISKNNPFTYREREEMFKEALDVEVEPANVFSLLKYMVDNIFGREDIVFYAPPEKTKRRTFARLFGYETTGFGRLPINSTSIREKLYSGDPSWGRYVSPGVKSVISSIEGLDSRIQELSRSFQPSKFRGLASFL